jgi:hypothetical protein
LRSFIARVAASEATGTLSEHRLEYPPTVLRPCCAACAALGADVPRSRPAPESLHTQQEPAEAREARLLFQPLGALPASTLVGCGRVLVVCVQAVFQQFV